MLPYYEEDNAAARKIDRKGGTVLKLVDYSTLLLLQKIQTAEQQPAQLTPDRRQCWVRSDRQRCRSGCCCCRGAVSGIAHKAAVSGTVVRPAQLAGGRVK